MYVGQGHSSRISILDMDVFIKYLPGTARSSRLSSWNFTFIQRVNLGCSSPCMLYNVSSARASQNEALPAYLVLCYTLPAHAKQDAQCRHHRSKFSRICARVRISGWAGRLLAGNWHQEKVPTGLPDLKMRHVPGGRLQQMVSGRCPSGTTHVHDSPK